MKQSLKELSEFTIETKDGTKGKVKDFLFDEKSWVIHYLEAKFGGLQMSEKILIPRVFLRPPVWKHKHFPTELAKSEIEKCPKISDHLPVSRKYEEELIKYFDIVPYWSTAYFGPVGSYYPPRPIYGPLKSMEEKDMDTILRSFREVVGYRIDALDGKLGQIDDLIIDDEDWQIVYAVVDTSTWLPWSKKVLIAIEWMDKISYGDREVKIKLKKETIKNAEEYDPLKVIDEYYEKGLYDYFSMSLEK